MMVVYRQINNSALPWREQANFQWDAAAAADDDDDRLLLDQHA